MLVLTFTAHLLAAEQFANKHVPVICIQIKTNETALYT